MGLRTIAVYSEADRNALHVSEADEAIAIGASPAAESYLVAEKLIAAARAAGADCIHPGYGFLSENADFAQSCRDAGIAFIGPSPDAIRAMGLKDRAKALMEEAGVPVVPGYHGDKQDAAFLKRKAYEIGYPVLIKAVAGGGGKGMRRVERHADFDDALASCMREAQSAFGDARVLIEKYVARPRHIEFQVFGDRHGNVIHLGERDCSLQRRHQKVIEEAPAPGMSASLRAAMGKAAVAAAKAVNYEGAGTIEFIADGAGGLKAGGFWFMEMNTRLQVEHPVTEGVTGLDLVEWQFRVAAGEKLPLKQDQVRFEGHAVEARLYAEDPERGFLPSTGKLIALRFPQTPGLRIDSGVEAGDTVTPFYDPMIAKLIAHGATRDEALDRLAECAGSHRRRRSAQQCRFPRRARARRCLPQRRFRHRLHRCPSRRARRLAARPRPRRRRQRRGANCWRASVRAHRRHPRPRSAALRLGTRTTAFSCRARAGWRCRSSPMARPWWRRSPTVRPAPRSRSMAQRRPPMPSPLPLPTPSMCCAAAARPRSRCAISRSIRPAMPGRAVWCARPCTARCWPFWSSRARP